MQLRCEGERGNDGVLVLTFILTTPCTACKPVTELNATGREIWIEIKPGCWRERDRERGEIVASWLTQILNWRPDCHSVTLSHRRVFVCKPVLKRSTFLLSTDKDNKMN